MPEFHEEMAEGYRFEGEVIGIGRPFVDPDAPLTDVEVGIPVRMLNRHGLIAGATGTGKTVTLQLLAEQIAAAGSPVFAADMKGDLSGVGAQGEASERIAGRAADLAHDWSARGAHVELAEETGHVSGLLQRLRDGLLVGAHVVPVVWDFGPDRRTTRQDGGACR